VLAPPWCARCGAPTTWPVASCVECVGQRLSFTTARAGVAYADAARPLLRAWKEGGLRTLAEVATEIVAAGVPVPTADLVTWIPADGDRSLRRGHHPAAALAAGLGQRWNIDVVPLLRRRRSVARQTGLARTDRRANVRDAFVATVSLDGRRIVLVDDVYTTGATTSAAAEALTGAGAAAIEVVTFARTVR